MSDTAAPVLAGAVAGCVMTVVGHPFDTLKVRMQTASSSVYSSTWACAKQTVSAEGFLALYKGLQPALLTTCVTSGLRFGVQHRFNDALVAMLRPASDHKLLRRRYSAATPTISSHGSFDQLSVTARVLAEGGGGAACGLVLPLIFTPLELIKIRRQVLQDNSLTNLQIFRTIWRESGLGGLYSVGTASPWYVPPLATPRSLGPSKRGSHCFACRISRLSAAARKDHGQRAYWPGCFPAGRRSSSSFLSMPPSHEYKPPRAVDSSVMVAAAAECCRRS